MRVLLGIWIGLTSACGAAEPRPSVLLVTLDTLRADHVGAYGDAARTPSLDRLAAQATVFEQAAAPMPMTLPSHFSLFTGRYPREHGVLSNALALPDSARVLTEVLSESGYQTGAFVAVSLLDEDSGAAQGFATFDGPRGARQRPAEEVVPRALEWLGECPEDEPFFLWVHLFDPHLPYEPPAEFRSGLDPALARELPKLDLHSIHRLAAQNGGDLPAEVLAHARALYRGEVEYLDGWIGKLLEGVDARNGGETLTVFVADHGESFERGVFFEHTESLGEGALRIPLLIRFPRLFPAGARVSQQVSMVDLAPTILEALELPPLPNVAGRSLRGLAAEGERYVLVQHPVYSSETLANRKAMHAALRSVAGEPARVIHDGEDMTGVVGAGWKYLRTSSGREELYRLGDEGTELGAREPARLLALRAELERQLAAHPVTILDADKIDPGLLKELQDLGYGQ